MATPLVDYGASDDEDIESTNSMLPTTTTTMPPPPTDQFFESFDEAMNFINNHTKNYGYALTTKRSTSKNGAKVRAYLQCNRGGVFKPHVTGDARVRDRSTRRIDCPFMSNPGHNHDPAPISSHPTLRQLEVQEQASHIENQFKNGANTRQVMLSLDSNTQGESNIRPQDVYNLRQQLRKKFLGGLTPVQRLITTLPEEHWIFNWQTEEDGVLISLFCVHKSSLQFLKRNPYILFMDCTYKTNSFKMPLLDIVGSTATNATFYVGFAFLSTEKQESYEFALECLHKVYQDLHLSDPLTILTDKDDALLNAVKAIFPQTSSMICIWHHNKDFLAYSRSILRREVLEAMTPEDRALPDSEYQSNFKERVKEKWEAMLKKWQRVLYARTHDDMEQAWEDFKQEYRAEAYQPIIRYLRREWLDSSTKHRLLTCYTKAYIHFGNSSTSRNEGAHYGIKRYLEVSTNDLLTTCQNIDQTITLRHREVQARLEQDRINRPLRFLEVLFRDVLGKISSYALYKTAALRDEYLPEGPGKKTIPVECTGNTRHTQGIPCIHTIKQVFMAKQSLSPNHFHMHWWLYESHDTPPVDPRLLVLEPRVVRTRGRPAGSTNHAPIASQPASEPASQQAATPALAPASTQDTNTQRDPSLFEIVLSQEASGNHGGRRGASGARGGRGGTCTASNHQQTGTDNQHEGDTQPQQGRQRGGRNRGRGRGVARQQQADHGEYEGIPAEMTGVIQF